jgi:hypothetical protein
MRRIFFVGLLVGLSLFGVIKLNIRHPIVAGIIGIVVGLLIIVKRDVRLPFINKNVRIVLLVLLVFLTLFLLIMNSAFFSNYLPEQHISRFTEYGLSTPRYIVWKKVLTGIFQYPFGGRQIALERVSSAHNLWLDVGYSAGLLPFILLLGFHFAHLPDLMRIVRYGQVTLFNSVLLVSFVGVVLAELMVEPVQYGAPRFLFASFFVFGLIRGIGGFVLKSKSVSNIGDKKRYD